MAAVVRGARGRPKAFLIPIPATHAPNHSVTLVERHTAEAGSGALRRGRRRRFCPGRRRADSHRETHPRLAAAFERLHLLWFDEPCLLVKPERGVPKIASENVTPVGFGRFAAEPGSFRTCFAAMHRRGPARPRAARHHTGRRISAVAEPYYVAVAPFHDGGPIATAAALNLAASLPNFFIQQIPFPAAEQDRRMRARLAGDATEIVKRRISATAAGTGAGHPSWTKRRLANIGSVKP